MKKISSFKIKVLVKILNFKLKICLKFFSAPRFTIILRSKPAKKRSMDEHSIELNAVKSENNEKKKILRKKNSEAKCVTCDITADNSNPRTFMQQLHNLSSTTFCHSIKTTFWVYQNRWDRVIKNCLALFFTKSHCVPLLGILNVMFREIVIIKGKYSDIRRTDSVWWFPGRTSVQTFNERPSVMSFLFWQHFIRPQILYNSCP